MQGTGTQNDPFYPTTWSEFVTAITTTDAYVECPENGAWDMNEMLPDGIESNINWKANTVHGNGLNIINLCFNGGRFAFNNSTYKHNIYKLNFLNMSTSGNSSNMFYFYVSDGHKGGTIYFMNCKFSGLISSGSVFNFSHDTYLTHDNQKSCSLNFNFTGSGTLGASHTMFRYCNIKLDGKSTGNFTVSSAEAFGKCYISGKWPWTITEIFGSDNVLDIEIPDNTKIGGASNGHMRTSVINIDKMHGSYVTTSYKYIEVTTEQLADVAYLRSKGFSIVG